MRNGEQWGINGAGRIGQRLLAMNEHLNRSNPGNERGIVITAVNEPFANIDNIVASLRHDLVHGNFPGEVAKGGHDMIVVNGRRVKVTHEKDPEKAWAGQGLFGVLEATGQFRKRGDAARHMDGTGIQQVLITAPSADSDLSLVHGINDEQFTGQDIVDNASCTTKSALPVLKVLDEAFGVKDCVLETVHAATGLELRALMDRFRLKDEILGRIMAEVRRDAFDIKDMDWILDENTGAAANVTRIFTHLEGKFRARAKRVPTLNGSLSIMNMVLDDHTAAPEDIKHMLEISAEELPAGVLRVVPELPSTALLQEYYDDAVVPRDRIGGNVMMTVVAGYNNEAGPARSAVQTARYMEDWRTRSAVANGGTAAAE